MTPDVNVLVAAARADHPHHAPALAWLTATLESVMTGERLVLLPMVAAGFVRVVTQKRIFPVPTPTPAAFAFVRALEERGVRRVDLGAEWAELARLCQEHDLAGGDVSDAWIAAAVSFHHEHLVTFDRAFRRFLPQRQLTILRC